MRNRLRLHHTTIQIIALVILVALPTYLIQAQSDLPQRTIEPIETDIEAQAYLPMSRYELEPTATPFPTPTPTAAPQNYGEVVNVAFGVNFINSVDQPADASQFAAGKSTGATWNRWPLYWPRIETGEGVFDWGSHDQVVQADIDNGWLTNAILLGTPGFYVSSRQLVLDESAADLNGTPGTINLNANQTFYPRGLRDPIFDDGSDIPGDGKSINPNNKWAVFVNEIVNRYKPGGVLATQNGWAPGVGITHWEMWNEPDYINFWAGSVEDYARLLKVGYIVAKEADPNSVILFGGLANIDQPNFYEDVLAIYAQDSQATSQNFYHDILATHAYSYAWNSWFLTFKTTRTMNDYNLSKPIWINESGVPAWDDYPGPIWDSKSGFRSTMAEQSDYTIQHTFYALYAGADAIFHFQLYDGCGNQPAGTDFPPHNSELCDGSGNYNGKPCAGDAFGLFRNLNNMACFTQHPEPGTARPYLNSFQFLTTHFTDVAPYWRQRLGDDDDNAVTGTIEVIALYQPSSGNRIVGVWTLSGDQQTVEIEATSDSAQLYDVAGNSQTITPEDGVYRLTLEGATNQNFPSDPDLWMIGGRPLVLIEADPTAVSSE